MKYIAIVGGDRTDLARVDEVIMKEVEAKQFFLFTVLCNQAAPAGLSKDWADLRGCPVEYIKVNSLEHLFYKADYCFFVYKGEQWMKNAIMKFKMMGKHGTVINV